MSVIPRTGDQSNGDSVQYDKNGVVIDVDKSSKPDTVAIAKKLSECYRNSPQEKR